MAITSCRFERVEPPADPCGNPQVQDHSARRRARILAGIAILVVAGCSPADEPAASAAAPQPKSTAREAIEGFTGKTSVDAGQRAKRQIQDINKTRSQSFEEF